VPAAVLAEAPELEGLVEWRDERAVLTVAGRMLASEITMRLQTQVEEGLEPAGILPR
jgi:hypothetical protein